MASFKEFAAKNAAGFGIGIFLTSLVSFGLKKFSKKKDGGKKAEPAEAETKA